MHIFQKTEVPLTHSQLLELANSLLDKELGLLNLRQQFWTLLNTFPCTNTSLLVYQSWGPSDLSSGCQLCQDWDEANCINSRNQCSQICGVQLKTFLGKATDSQPRSFSEMIDKTRVDYPCEGLPWFQGPFGVCVLKQTQSAIYTQGSCLICGDCASRHTRSIIRNLLTGL